MSKAQMKHMTRSMRVLETPQENILQLCQSVLVHSHLQHIVEMDVSIFFSPEKKMKHLLRSDSCCMIYSDQSACSEFYRELFKAGF